MLEQISPSYGKAFCQKPVESIRKSVERQKPLLQKTEWMQNDEEKGEKRKPKNKVC